MQNLFAARARDGEGVREVVAFVVELLELVGGDGGRGLDARSGSVGRG